MSTKVRIPVASGKVLMIQRRKQKLKSRYVFIIFFIPMNSFYAIVILLFPLQRICLTFFPAYIQISCAEIRTRGNEAKLINLI
ncbi:hypothetical protein HanRHA438_Chr01g0039961 [Helianthus annuus]|nr:hypothetical protein HanRHA438_Chr01g0039961 [Helianthus annuus]